LEGPAEIVIEILSKSTREIDLEKKLPAYLSFGIKEIWIIDPEEKKLSIHTQTKTQDWDISQGNANARSNVLSKFYLQINWLWERDKYKPGQLVRHMLAMSKRTCEHLISIPWKRREINYL
jgi:Uma2 family endonuclease